MKQQYQIDRQRAVQQFRRLASQENPNIQMILPTSSACCRTASAICCARPALP